VRLLILDEVHLLGEDRGAVLEAIVSRTRFISRFVQEEQAINSDTSPEWTRIIGLSTALANSKDLADWIGIDTKSHGPRALRGLYNFRPSVRPVPVTVHVQGYTGRHYCPRMATMNKPCFAAIKEYSPTKPTLIFVASRRQTRLTAFDIISYAASDEEPKRFLGCSSEYIESVTEGIRDDALKHTLNFGIGLHHAGLSSHDRDIVEKMFLGGEIRVLVATATLAWGVNLPAHLVIVKGTEYFDGKSSRYVDYPLTDVLQMIGRAGRPGFDTEGSAVVMALEEKKPFYKKFLYESFPVESCLDQRMCENLNAEIASGTIGSIVEGAGYLTWTFFARRVKANPSYYGAESSDDAHVEEFLLSAVKEALGKLSSSGCIEFEDETDETASVKPLSLGIAASNFYLVHKTPKQMEFGVKQARKLITGCLQESPPPIADERPKEKTLGPFARATRVDEVSLGWLLYVVSSTHEFDEHPVRHNEEYLNQELAAELMWGPDTSALISGRGGQHSIEIFQDPHTKCFLLLQAHLERAKLPISDYVNDTRSVVDNVPRLLAAMQYIASQDGDTSGSFELLTQFCRTRQYFETRSLVNQDPLSLLPGVTADVCTRLKNGAKSKKKGSVSSILEMRSLSRKEATLLLQRLNRNKANHDDTIDALFAFPLIRLVDCSVRNETDKTTGKSIGKLKIELEIQRDQSQKRRAAKRESSTWTLLLGSYQQGFLLAQSSFHASRYGKWTVSKELAFDWNTANADGGEGSGKIVLRVLSEEVRGFDCEATISLK
jgi:activating signal cointegrator complex subunit 3